MLGRALSARAGTGGTTLDKLLSHTGVPLKVCKQPWSHVSEADRTQLLAKIRHQAHVGSDFGLDETLFYESFVRATEMEAPVSAADVVYSMHGLLAAGGAASAHLYTLERALEGQAAGGGEAGDGAAEAGGGAAGGAGAAPAAPYDPGKPSRRWTECFALAYDSLSRSCVCPPRVPRPCVLIAHPLSLLPRHSELFHEGLMRYRGLSRAIARVAFASKDRVAKGRHVRALVLNDDLSEQDRLVFTQVRRGRPEPFFSRPRLTPPPPRLLRDSLRSPLR